MPIRSYVRSTDYHRKPCGENILCGINVSVMVRSTFWTIPLPNIKRQFINNMTAVPTALRARKPTVNFYQCSTVPLPANRQRLGTFCQPQLPILPLKSRTGKLSTSTTPFLFEVGVFGATRPKIGKRFLQMSQTLLQWYATHLVEELDRKS